MATCELTPIRDDVITPVKFYTGTTNPYGSSEDPRLQEISGKIGREGRYYVSELKSIAADAHATPGPGDVALGYLLAIQHRGKLDSHDLIEFLVTQAHATAWHVREDALNALAHLRGERGCHPEALDRLIALAADPKYKDGRHDVLKALATTHDPRALESLALGVIEIGEASETGSFLLAKGVRDIWGVEWRDKARAFVSLLQKSARQRNEIHAAAILQALGARGGEPPHMQELEDFFIEEALSFEEPPNVRMSGILAELIIGCEGGDHEQAGHRINAYLRNHELPATALYYLRREMGGAPALSGIMGVLQTNLDTYFQKPIHKLNEETRTGWHKALKDAARGFAVRVWMSITVFVLGAFLVLGSTCELLFKMSAETSLMAFAAVLTAFGAGLGTMFLIIYVGPIKEIRQAVNDLASANAAFMAYVHRILETSHTFSYHYLKDQMSFEKMQQSSEIIRDAMDNTIRVLNMDAIDSAQGVIQRAVTVAFDRERQLHAGEHGKAGTISATT
jgi:hypothetical protein